MPIEIADRSRLLDEYLNGWAFDEDSSGAAKKLEKLTDSLGSIAEQISRLQEPLMKHGAKVFAEYVFSVLTKYGLRFSDCDGRLILDVDFCEFEGLSLELDILDHLKTYYDHPDDRKRVVGILRTMADALEEE